MSISDAEAARIRRAGAYRAAVWMVRLTLVIGLVWAWRLFTVRQTGSVIFGTWLAAAGPLACALGLLRRSGVRFVRRGLSWYAEDDRVARQFYRDVYWFRRR